MDCLEMAMQTFLVVQRDVMLMNLFDCCYNPHLFLPISMDASCVASFASQCYEVAMLVHELLRAKMTIETVERIELLYQEVSLLH